MIIVQKYGGSSVADNERLYNVADRIRQIKDEGYDVVVVVSARGKTTDLLINKANEINSEAPEREMDMLLSTGEQQSVALLAIMLNKLGVPAVSLTGEQAGIFTVNGYCNARIDEIRPYRVFDEIEKGNVVIVAGFQGVNDIGDVTTLGRGGSDTTAVALAAALEAERCEIYSDVDGVYTADPRIVENAKKIDKISYDVMLELASLGAKVLNSRSVELAKKYNVKLTSSSSFERKEGTEITGKGFENVQITGFTADRNISVFTLRNIKDRYSLLVRLADMKIPVDIIAQNMGLEEISFSAKKADVKKILDIVCDECEFSVKENCGKVSVVGAGLINKCEVAKNIYEALRDKNIKIYLVSNSEIKFSVIVDADVTDIALNAIHDRVVG